MAAALSALNAKIRSQPLLSYVCSTRTSIPHLSDQLRTEAKKKKSPMRRTSYKSSRPRPPPTPNNSPNDPPPRCPPTDSLRAKQISGVRSPTLASPSQRSWTPRKIQKCPFPPSPLPPHYPLPSLPPPTPRGLRSMYVERGGFIFPCAQYIRPHDGRPGPLFGHLYALLPGRAAKELSAVRMPLCQFQRAADAGVAVFAVLEVSFFFFFFFFLGRIFLRGRFGFFWCAGGTRVGWGDLPGVVDCAGRLIV